MEMFKSARRAAVIGVLTGLAGCLAPPAPAGPPVEVPTATDLMHSKVDAYNAGLAAGKRQQTRHDQAALAAAAAPPACPAPAPAPPPAALATPRPAATQAPIYIPGGPAIPVAPAQ